jgi:REP element-mobilizing transposase RayT
LRKGRVSEPGRSYVVTTVTQDRRPLFTDWAAGRVVVDSLRRLHAGGDVTSLAFVVMPDHVHWLFTLASRSTLPFVVQGFKGGSARRLGKRVAGPVWQRGYYDHALRGDEDLRAQARYIVANPLRAGLVHSLGDYPLWDAVWLDGPLAP